MNEQAPSSGRRKKFRMEFSSAGLFFGAIGLVFVLGWIFVLGIMVGRGFVPEGVRSLGHMTEQLTRLVAILGSDRERDTGTLPGKEKQARLDFYDQLARTAPGAATESAGGKITPARTSPSAPVPAGSGPPKITEGEKPRWVVQVASLDSESKAVELTEKLKNLGYPAYNYRTFVKGTSFHRVRCGPFQSKADAETTRRLLAEREKINAFLTTVEN